MQLSLALARSPLESVRDALLDEFGPQRPVTRMDPISQLVKSSISGRTLDAVSWAAFLRLRAEFKSWDDLADAPVPLVAGIVHDVTFPTDKARHLTTALRMIRDKVGWLSLSHLRGLSVDQARWALQTLPGVGVKVAACVLNFSDLAMRTLVVDSHVDRVAKRLGLVGGGDTIQTYRSLMALAPDAWSADDLFELHWLMKRGLGQMLCPHEGPRCGACPLKATCAKAGVGHSAEVLAWRPRA